jgi:hypothetical protein
MTMWNTWQSLLAAFSWLAVFGLLAWLAARHVEREIQRQDTPRPRTGASDAAPPDPRTGPASSSPPGEDDEH